MTTVNIVSEELQVHKDMIEFMYLEIYKLMTIPDYLPNTELISEMMITLGFELGGESE